MNPGERAWLERLIRYQKNVLTGEVAAQLQAAMQEAEDVHHFLYELIRPSGLMYGYPIQFLLPPHSKADTWTEKDKIKLLLAEAYLLCGLYYYQRPEAELSQNLDQVIEDVRDFYQENFALYLDKRTNIFGRRKTAVEQVEYILDRRISVKYDWRNFWNSFFHNSLLFFDLIFFVEWRESREDIPRQTLAQRRLDLRLDILTIIAAAAHADEHIHRQEKELFTFFLQSANLDAPRKRQAEKFFREGVPVEELDFEQLDPSWLLRKYFLELGILTSWASRRITDREQVFLRKLAHQLDLSEVDFQSSMDAVKHFVDKYWEQVHYLQIKQNYRIVSQRLMKRLKQIVRNNQRLIEIEVQQSRELMQLLQKSMTEELSKEEKERMRTQLIDVLKVIPAFAFLFLPGSFLTLPILLRIIPKQVLYPSAYLKEQAGEE